MSEHTLTSGGHRFADDGLCIVTEDHTRAQVIAALEAALITERVTSAALFEALLALAKEQYDGTVEGLVEQVRTEDWGDHIDIGGLKAAYELTLAALRYLQGQHTHRRAR